MKPFITRMDSLRGLLRQCRIAALAGALLVALLNIQAFSYQHSDGRVLRGKLSNDNPFKRGQHMMRQLVIGDFLDPAELDASGRASVKIASADAVEDVAKRLNKRLKGFEFNVAKTDSDNRGNRYVKLFQTVKGIPVIGSDIIVRVSAEGEVSVVSGNILLQSDIALKPAITAAQSKHALGTEISAAAATNAVDSQLVIFDGRLAYKIEINTSEGQPARWKCFVDAQTGELLLGMNTLTSAAPGASGAHVAVQGSRLDGEDGAVTTMQGWRDNGGNYFLYHKTGLWGLYNIRTSDWEQRATSDWGTSDRAAISLAGNLDITQNYVRTVLGRNSFNNAGAFARGNIHQGTNYVNAYWDGSDFHFGDGDGTQAGPLTVLDVAAHEYGHAITENTSNLEYQDESGALNESFSDILGTLVEFSQQTDGRSAYPGRTAGRADWLCGEDCWLQDVALRDLRNPQRYGQPSYYSGTNWYSGSSDNGGVHTNSGVQNFVFYLLAEGGSGTNDGRAAYSITGLGITVAGQIGLYANMHLLTSSSQYRDSRNAWILAAQTLGYNAQTVADVWTAAGVLPLEKHLASSASSLAFGAVGRGSRRTMNLTLSNNGGDATLVSGIGFSNPRFSTTTAAPFLVPSAGSVTVPVVFAPTADGSQTGTMLISSNAVDNPAITVSLSGSGTAPAQLTVAPVYFHQTLPTGDSATHIMTLTNPGAAALEFSIAEAAVTGLTLQGGPDVFGYRWIDSDQLGGPAYAWNSISGTGTLLSTVSGCDDCFQAAALSFAFPFYGNSFTTVYVSSNGYLTFGAGSSKYSRYSLPNSNMPANLIAPFFADLYPGSSGDIYFQDFGDRAIVQFSNVAAYSGSGSYTYQVVLHANGEIDFYYNSLTGSTSATTVGIQNAAATTGLTLAYNTAYLKNGLAVRIQNAFDWLTFTPQSGTIAGGAAANVSVKISAREMVGGRYISNLLLTHNAASVASPFAIPCTLDVTGLRRLAAAPAALNFGAVAIGADSLLTLTLTNSGSDTTTVSAMSFDNTLFRHSTPMPLKVPPFVSVNVPVSFLPDSVKSETGTLQIAGNAFDNPTISIAVSGRGTVGPAIALAPAFLHRAVNAGDSVTTPVRISNGGGDTLRCAVQTSESSTAFASAASNVWPGAQRWNTEKSSETGAEASLSANNSSFQGAVVDYPFFDGFETGTYSTNWTAGSGTYVRAATAATAATGVYSFTQTGGSSSVFNGVSADFSPAQRPEAISFSVRASSNTVSGTYVALCGGTGRQDQIIWFYMKSSGYLFVNDNETVPYLANTWYSISLRLNWTAYTFDYYVNNQLVAQAIPFRTQTPITAVYLFNYANTQGWWDNISIGNAPSSWLSASPLSVKVAPGSFADVAVKMNARNLTAGLFSGRLAITHNAAATATPAVVPCTLEVSGVKRLSVSPAAVEFGSTWVGDDSTLTVALSNGGTDTTLISSMTLRNSVFTQNLTAPLRIPPASSILQRVTFRPDSLKEEFDTLRISSNAVDYPAVAVPLHGRGVSGPAIAVIPGFLRLSANAGDSAAASVGISNSGADTLRCVIQANASSSGWLSALPLTLKIAPGSFADAAVKMNARNLSAGMVTGNLAISHNVPGTGDPVAVPCTLTVLNPNTPLVAFETASQTVQENVGAVTVRAALSWTSLNDVSVPFTVSGTAGSPADHNLVGGTLILRAGTLRDSVRFQIVQDQLFENNETVILTMGTPIGGVLGSVNVHTVTVFDDDPAPTIQFTSASQRVGENVGTLSITARLSAPAGVPVTLPFSLNGSATGGGTDYASTASPITVAAGSTSANIVISVTDDTLQEDDETILVTMGAPVNASVGETNTHTVWITDNDYIGSIHLSGLDAAARVFLFASSGWLGIGEFSGSGDLALSPGRYRAAVVQKNKRTEYLLLTARRGMNDTVSVQMHDAVPMIFDTLANVTYAGGGAVTIGLRGSAVMEDVDRDGDEDLVTLSRGGVLSIFDNSNGLQPPLNYPLGLNGGEEARSLRIVDTDNDNVLDYLVGLSTGEIVAFKGSTLVRSTVASAQSGLTSVELCDFNEDNNFDLLVGYEDGTVDYIASSGAGGYFAAVPVANPAGSPLSVGLDASAMCLTMDADSLPALVVGNKNGEIAWFKRRADGTYSPQGAVNAGGRAMTLPGGEANPVFGYRSAGQLPRMVVTDNGGYVYQSVAGLAGDFNRDGTVGFVDYMMLVNAWGASEGETSYDRNVNLVLSSGSAQTIDFYDYMYFVSVWNLDLAR